MTVPVFIAFPSNLDIWTETVRTLPVPQPYTTPYAYVPCHPNPLSPPSEPKAGTMQFNDI